MSLKLHRETDDMNSSIKTGRNRKAVSLISRAGSTRRIIFLLTTALVVMLSTSCVYYNLFHNTKKEFYTAEKARKKSRTGQGNVSSYRKAIDKSLKLIELHPNSKYYDDALYILSVSYYHTGQFSKSERRARELLANYPESKYIRDATLYMAKSKLELRDIEEAMEIFEDIFEANYSKEFKAEAALALGDYHHNKGNYEEARPYLLSLRDSLGTQEDGLVSQMLLADGLYERYRFADALEAYLQVLGFDAQDDDYYKALTRAADCCYQLQRIEDGHAYLERLINDDIYFDSLGVLKLAMAEGYEVDEDIPAAEILYTEVVEEDTRRNRKAEAYWRMGLIQQFEYDDLEQAKIYYDSVVALGRSTDIGKQALKRSSDIGKITDFAPTLVIDSTTTQEAIDDAAYTQYLLAELYWFNLDKPDTAMLEMQYVIDSFPTAYDTPKAIIALSQMVREYDLDTARADSLLYSVLEDYPKSDYVPEALEILGLKGTAADTGYAQLYFDRAEQFLADLDMPDSAKIEYQRVVDRFPDSKYHLHAQFAILWIEDNYFNPGDSSVYFAYNEFVDSFQGTEWATVAQSITQYRPSRRPTEVEGEEGDTLPPGDEYAVNDQAPGRAADVLGEDAGSLSEFEDAIYTDPTGGRALLFTQDPIRTDEKFEYPQEAYFDKWEGDIYIQILLDFSGEVEDYELKTRAPNDVINERIEMHITTSQWDVTRIPTELQGGWLVYKFAVRLPDHLR